MTRIEAAVKAWDHYWGDRYGDEALEEMGDEVKVALAAADAHDAAHGIHRLVIDAKTIERAARRLIWRIPALTPTEHMEAIARAVLAAAVEAGQ